jgi:hypothetical protein
VVVEAGSEWDCGGAAGRRESFKGRRSRTTLATALTAGDGISASRSRAGEVPGPTGVGLFVRVGCSRDRGAVFENECGEKNGGG